MTSNGGSTCLTSSGKNWTDMVSIFHVPFVVCWLIHDSRNLGNVSEVHPVRPFFLGLKLYSGSGGKVGAAPLRTRMLLSVHFSRMLWLKLRARGNTWLVVRWRTETTELSSEDGLQICHNFLAVPNFSCRFRGFSPLFPTH